jgi:hypothetical protein
LEKVSFWSLYIYIELLLKIDLLSKKKRENTNYKLQKLSNFTNVLKAIFFAISPAKLGKKLIFWFLK